MPGILSEGHKGALRHILSEVGVANHPERSGIDEINVAAHQLGKGGLRMAAGVVLQELLVGLSVHS